MEPETLLQIPKHSLHAGMARRVAVQVMSLNDVCFQGSLTGWVLLSPLEMDGHVMQVLVENLGHFRSIHNLD